MGTGGVVAPSCLASPLVVVTVSPLPAPLYCDNRSHGDSLYSCSKFKLASTFVASDLWCLTVFHVEGIELYTIKLDMYLCTLIVDTTRA